MEDIFAVAALWLGLAVFSAVVAYHLRVSIALVEICVGVIAAALAGYLGKLSALGSDLEWLKFLAASGAVLLTFLAGAELEPEVIRKKLREVSIVGLVGFFAPFLGCAAIAFYVLDWNLQASLLCGVALSTTSMAVVYAVMLETGFNRIDFGKGILGACFVNDLGTVIALGVLFAPFTYKTVIFIGVTAFVLAVLPFASRWLTRLYAYGTAAIRTKWVILTLFGLGALALWSGSEAVLPAYLVGIVLAEFSNGDTFWIRRRYATASALLWVVSGTSLFFLALLGSLGAFVGGAPIIKAAVRVTFWGALAMALTAGVGALFGVAA